VGQARTNLPNVCHSLLLLLVLSLVFFYVHTCAFVYLFYYPLLMLAVKVPPQSIESVGRLDKSDNYSKQKHPEQEHQAGQGTEQIGYTKKGTITCKNTSKGRRLGRLTDFEGCVHLVIR